MRRLPFLGTLLGAVLLTFGMLGVSAVKSANAARQANLSRDVQQSAAAFDAYFERAQSLNLLLTQNPVFQQFFTVHHGDRSLLVGRSRIRAGLDDALAYLERLCRADVVVSAM